MQPYRAYYPQARLVLPQTEQLAARIIVLPTGAAVGPPEIKRVCGIIRQTIYQADAVREALRLQPISPAPVIP
jgi:dTDP-4-amino-4,6-dideoxygalactose transaminase